MSTYKKQEYLHESSFFPFNIKTTNFYTTHKSLHHLTRRKREPLSHQAPKPRRSIPHLYEMAAQKRSAKVCKTVIISNTPYSANTSNRSIKCFRKVRSMASISVSMTRTCSLGKSPLLDSTILLMQYVPFLIQRQTCWVQPSS